MISIQTTADFLLNAWLSACLLLPYAIVFFFPKERYVCNPSINENNCSERVAGKKPLATKLKTKLQRLKLTIHSTLQAQNLSQQSSSKNKRPCIGSLVLLIARCGYKSIATVCYTPASRHVANLQKSSNFLDAHSLSASVAGHPSPSPSGG